MKNKGIIIVIALILIMGAGLTVSTQRYISDKTSGSMAAAEEQLPASGDGAVTEAPSMSLAGLTPPATAGGSTGTVAAGAGVAGPGVAGADAAGSGQEKASGAAAADGTTARNAPADSRTAGEMAGDTAEMAQAVTENTDGAGADAAGSAREESVSGMAGKRSADAPPDSQANISRDSAPETKSSVAISPLTGANEAGTDTDTAITEYTATLQGYRKNLQEIDNLIEDLQGTDTSANTDSLKNAADYEYRLWDTQLNRIYQSVLDGMTEAEAECLRTEERQWIRDRDLAAKKAAAKYGGGTMESLQYTASLARSTRDRAYALLDDYGTYLKQEDE